jgi:hypothetical protein
LGGSHSELEEGDVGVRGHIYCWESCMEFRFFTLDGTLRGPR